MSIATDFGHDHHAQLWRHGHGVRCRLGQAVWALSRLVGRIADRIDPVSR